MDSNKLKDSLNLPKTNFPMQAKLVEREVVRWAHWDSINLYDKVLEKNANGEAFILHDGPPFTNGDVHIGTALNKILKDIILRYKSMSGYYAPYVPGWDCHGLPIEHKVSKEKPELLADTVSLRKACNDFSEAFIKIQERQFKRLGVLADWKNPYKTKDASYEGDVLRLFAKFVKAGLVYRSKKPVYWSIPCKTALAEAEIEYKNHTSTAIWVEFELLNAASLGVKSGCSVVIWTTTPWTIPANRAIALSPSLEYVEVIAGEKSFIVAKSLAENFAKECSIEEFTLGKTFLGNELSNFCAQHPFLDKAVPIVMADYVTLDAGTGCVHTAPGHGMDDYLTGLKYNLEIACPVDDDGKFIADGLMPEELVGCAVYTEKGSPANHAVISLLEKKGALLKRSNYEHSYPHCWRSKSPVIFRAMPQWFIRLDSLKDKANAAIDGVNWVPAWGELRIKGSTEARPDWCISRQRSWGIPLPVFFDEAGEPLLDGSVVDSVAEKIAVNGSQWWFESDADEILSGVTLPAPWGNKKLKKGNDTLDVWIDSGCSHFAVLKNRLKWPADMYLEGSDQHRGWFQSSLWTALVDEGVAPYKTVLTHGFFVDENRKKVSKSDGSPQTADAYVGKYGADILRMWVASEDYRNDIPVSETIIQHVIGTYRTIRNTLRFQIGNLFDFDANNNSIPLKDLTNLDKWALAETNDLIDEVNNAYNAYEFHKVYHAINRFCTVTLSAKYHDILKDRLYTLGLNSFERRSSQTAIYLICNTLIKLIAPILVFSADEALAYLEGNSDFGYKNSVHLSDFPAKIDAWSFEHEKDDFSELLKIKEAVQLELEKARQNKIIGQSLDAKVDITIGTNNPKADLLRKYEQNLPEYFIVSAANVSFAHGDADLTIAVNHADGVRCPRTWRWVNELVEVDGYGHVSKRCSEILKNNK